MRLIVNSKSLDRIAHRADTTTAMVIANRVHRDAPNTEYS